MRNSKSKGIGYDKERGVFGCDLESLALKLRSELKQGRTYIICVIAEGAKMTRKTMEGGSAMVYHGVTKDEVRYRIPNFRFV
jgi:hypothetical protein